MRPALCQLEEELLPDACKPCSGNVSGLCPLEEELLPDACKPYSGNASGVSSFSNGCDGPRRANFGFGREIPNFRRLQKIAGTRIFCGFGNRVEDFVHIIVVAKIMSYEK